MRGFTSLFAGLFQVAYVTRDLDAAVALARTRFGIDRMAIQRSIRHSPTTTIDIALAWVGDRMIELIAPHGDGSSVYEALPIPEASTLRLHHMGHILPDEAGLTALRTSLAAAAIPVFVEREHPGLRFLFADTRPLLGHFTEHMIFSGDGRAMLDAVPRQPG